MRCTTPLDQQLWMEADDWTLLSTAFVWVNVLLPRRLVHWRAEHFPASCPALSGTEVSLLNTLNSSAVAVPPDRSSWIILLLRSLSSLPESLWAREETVWMSEGPAAPERAAWWWTPASQNQVIQPRLVWSHRFPCRHSASVSVFKWESKASNPHF